MVQIRIFVSGFVQGVGYRAFTMHTASKMNICGWTRNLSDGRVEILAQAPKETIDKFVKKLWVGSMLSEVKDITIDHEDITQHFSTFEKMPTV
jgi:acylphosphatase